MDPLSVSLPVSLFQWLAGQTHTHISTPDADRAILQLKLARTIRKSKGYYSPTFLRDTREREGREWDGHRVEREEEGWSKGASSESEGETERQKEIEEK